MGQIERERRRKKVLLGGGGGGGEKEMGRDMGERGREGG